MLQQQGQAAIHRGKKRDEEVFFAYAGALTKELENMLTVLSSMALLEDIYVHRGHLREVT
eukprot:12919040-Prorocentrum_lima.AAC.1